MFSRKSFFWREENKGSIVPDKSPEWGTHKLSLSLPSYMTPGQPVFSLQAQFFQL